MNKILRAEVEKEIEVLKKHFAGCNKIGVAEKDWLEKRGYQQEIIGAGKGAYTCSGMIDAREVKTKKFLNGNFLIVGISNIGYGEGVHYRGFVKEII